MSCADLRENILNEHSSVTPLTHDKSPLWRMKTIQLESSSHFSSLKVIFIVTFVIFSQSNKILSMVRAAVPPGNFSNPQLHSLKVDSSLSLPHETSSYVPPRPELSHEPLNTSPKLRCGTILQTHLSRPRWLVSPI